MPIFRKPEGVEAMPGRGRKRDIPEGIWTKCPACGEVLFNKELEANLMVCPKCGHHLTISARARLAAFCDPNSFEEYDAGLESVDVLGFTGVTSYPNRIKTYQEKTGLKDAVICGMAKLEGMPVSLAVMDFAFLGGSMGSVVGEKITRAIERASETKCPVIIFSASGGARMYEGMFSLMQLAKTSAALAKHAEKRLPFISVLTNPTMAGVMASFASLGDLIVAEPKAMIGFAGARVIKETTQQDLPKGFQTAEFLLEHGLIDQIIERNQLRSRLALHLRYMHGS
ncbi:MAG: acetyl-CoA carboxylase, carboxyltransferase subunit beta [Candidatus Methylacidiphilales bacterium]